MMSDVAGKFKAPGATHFKSRLQLGPSSEEGEDLGQQLLATHDQALAHL